VKQYRVIIPPVVQGQIRAQVLYIATDSIDAALAWEDRLHAAINAIGELPGSHAIDEDASARIGVTVHKMVFERTYLIHYLVNQDAAAVEIVNFRHGARLPRKEEP
jgi:plasmid stabilization system protein ParE